MKTITTLQTAYAVIAGFKAIQDTKALGMNQEQKKIFNNAVKAYIKATIDWKKLTSDEGYELGNNAHCFYDTDQHQALRELRSYICGQYKFTEAQIIDIGKNWHIPDISPLSFNFQAADLATVVRICTEVNNTDFWENTIALIDLSKKDLYELQKHCTNSIKEILQEKINGLKT